MNKTTLFTVLKVLLLSAAIGWGISALGIFLPWRFVADELTGLGAGDVFNDPMLNYWFRMTATAFTAIGVLFFILAVNLRKYESLVPFVGIFMIVEGLVLLIYGILLHVDPIPFYVDAAFCLFVGIGITIIQKLI